MAKEKKFPKKPKASASMSTLERYAQKCKEIEKHNASIVTDSNKVKAKRKLLLKTADDSKKRVEKLKSKVS